MLVSLSTRLIGVSIPALRFLVALAHRVLSDSAVLLAIPLTLEKCNRSRWIGAEARAAVCERGPLAVGLVGRVSCARLLLGGSRNKDQQQTGQQQLT